MNNTNSINNNITEIYTNGIITMIGVFYGILMGFFLHYQYNKYIDNICPKSEPELRLVNISHENRQIVSV